MTSYRSAKKGTGLSDYPIRPNSNSNSKTAKTVYVVVNGHFVCADRNLKDCCACWHPHPKWKRRGWTGPLPIPSPCEPQTRCFVFGVIVLPTAARACACWFTTSHLSSCPAPGFVRCVERHRKEAPSMTSIGRASTPTTIVIRNGRAEQNSSFQPARQIQP